MNFDFTATNSAAAVTDECAQVAMYEADTEERFVEVINIDFTVCPIVWSGYLVDASGLTASASLWTYFPSR